MNDILGGLSIGFAVLGLLIPQAFILAFVFFVLSLIRFPRREKR